MILRSDSLKWSPAGGEHAIKRDENLSDVIQAQTFTDEVTFSAFIHVEFSLICRLAYPKKYWVSERNASLTCGFLCVWTLLGTFIFLTRYIFI